MRTGGLSRRHSSEGGAVTATRRALMRVWVSAARTAAEATWLSKAQPGKWGSA